MTMQDHWDAPPECDHEDYEVNWEGRAFCRCGHSWWLSADQIAAQERAEREYVEWETGEARKYNR